MKMKPPSKAKKKSFNEYISKLKKKNSLLNRALNEEKKITRRLLGSKLAAEQKLDALQKAYNKQLGAINEITNFLKGTVNIFHQKAEYLNEIRMEANAIIDECNMTCHTTSINNHFLKRRTPSAPTRQVVQPMVGGFTIQRPIVNLARLSFSNNHNNELNRNNVQSIINNVPNVVSDNEEDEETEDDSTNLSNEREDREWITVSPVVRLRPLIIGDNRSNDSSHRNYNDVEEENENNTTNEEDESENNIGDINNDNVNINVYNNDVTNINSSTNNLQNSNIIQSMITDRDNTEEANSISAFTVDRSVNVHHSEHNGDL